MKHPLASIIRLALFVAISTSASASIVIDWVTISDPSNAAQSAANRTHSFGSGGDGYGAVAGTFRISRNETTLANYAAFLNAKAATDPYDLYNTSMASDLNSAGITRSGSSGSYSYTVTGSGARPITYVSWFDAARFTNWMHNGQGSGDTETGAYTMVGGQISGIAPARNVGAKVWIPTENEWFKAAYYDRTKGISGGYWLHANQSDSMTSNNFSVADAANYRAGDYATTPGNITYSPSQNYLTDAGAYGTNSQNYYGINDMAGNVWEWNDLTGASGSSRGLRGGSWNNNEDVLRSSFRVDTAPPNENSIIGFRVASAVKIPVQAEVATAIELFFNSTLGKTYLIEESIDLTVWTPLESGIVGTGNEIARLYSTRNVPKRFLKVSEVSP